MKPISISTKLSDEQIMEAVRQIKVAYKLKRTLRYASDRDLTVHNESVAEHVFALLFLAEYFLPFEDPDDKLDVQKLYRILLFHDFGEITHGDIPYHLKTKVDEEREQADAEEVFASLPPSLREIGHESWRAYTEKDGREARFAYALDKIEPLFELFDPINERSLKRTHHTYQDHIERKRKATEGFPVMQKFVEVVSKDMLERDVFWKEDTSINSK
ncbi:MAG: HD domain-containing protein [Candidatus Campbellbacteria bacterium]|nr:HD domain-containing protein [Candidatus Campbellbacteria bacterium]